MLSPAMIVLIETYPLGFVATVTPQGVPHLSPKGTFVVFDDRTIGFGHIRSPNTLANIAGRADVAINFIDVLARRAVLINGQATIFDAGSDAFSALTPHFDVYSAYRELIKAIVRIDITRASLVTSPAYDIGMSEADLKVHYKAKLAVF